MQRKWRTRKQNNHQFSKFSPNRFTKISRFWNFQSKNIFVFYRFSRAFWGIHTPSQSQEFVTSKFVVGFHRGTPMCVQNQNGWNLSIFLISNSDLSSLKSFSCSILYDFSLAKVQHIEFILRQMFMHLNKIYCWHSFVSPILHFTRINFHSPQSSSKLQLSRLYFNASK